MVTMASKRDYYEVLGVERAASSKVIADAYRKLAIKYHPDKNPGDEEAITRFKEAAEAFEILNDSDKRARYDRYGHAGVEGSGARHFDDVGDIFSAFGDIFGDIFGGGGGGRRRTAKGSDVRCNVTLDLVEAARGVNKKIEFERHERCTDCEGSGAKPGSSRQKCSYCGGRGQVIQSTGVFRLQTTCPSCHGAGTIIKDPCTGCRGAGYVLKRVKREVQIPAGIEDQMRVRLPGEGEPSPNGGPRGDCYCFVTVKDHPLFQREGQHLIVRVPISFSQAALGCQLDVPTLDGPHSLKVPGGTQSGDVFKVRGKGLPHVRSRDHGDLLVQVEIDVPKVLNPKQEELLRELAKLDKANVTPHRKSFLDKVREYFEPLGANRETEK
jgi:molecular chaperone DnaJ